MSARRIIVERPIADEFVEQLAEKTKGLKTGDPKEHDTIIGPLITEGALELVKGRVDDAVAEGREGARRRRGRRAVLPGDAARPTSRQDSRVRAARDVRPGRRDRGRRQRRRGGRARERDHVRARVRDHHERRRPGLRARAADRRRDRPRQRPDRSATSRRCRSAASRTAASGGSAARRSIDEFTELRWITVASEPHPSRSRRAAMAESSRSQTRSRELVHDGDTVALEGFTHLIPHAAGHELIRQGRRDLTLIRMTPDVVYDQLIGMGCARKLVFSWGGNPGVGSLHRLRDAVEHGWPRAARARGALARRHGRRLRGRRGEPAVRRAARLPRRRPRPRTRGSRR